MTAHHLRHALGLALVLLLVGGIGLVWLWLPRLIAGTPLQEIRLLLAFLAGVGLLTFADLVWSRIGGPPPEPDKG
jgi:hypothetical protein